MNKIFYILFITITLLASCKNDDVKHDLNSPEGTIIKWQGLVDSSKFELAKQYSTERAIVWLERNKKLSEEGDSLVYPLYFKSINCKTQGDSAVCDCIFTMPDDTTSYKDVYLAKKVNGKWAVDLSQDELEIFE